jgi:hypothetical protein
MTWAYVGRGGSLGSSVAATTVFSITMNGVDGSGADVGELLVCHVGVKPATTAPVVVIDGTTHITGIVDSSSNTWTKIREVTRLGAAVAINQTNSLWYARCDKALTTSQTVTVSAVTTIQASFVGIVSRFTNSGGSVGVKDTTFIAVGTSPNTTDLVTDGSAFLRFKAMCQQSTLASFSTTSGWTGIGAVRATAVNPAAAAYGEFLVTTASTAASNIPGLTTASKVGIMALFDEQQLMGDSEL